MNALLVCDDAQEIALLSFILQEAGLIVSSGYDIEKASHSLVESPADLILLALRQETPTAQVRRVRRDTGASLAVVAISTDEDELCRALDAGADLVITRPYSSRLLLCQLRALLRRSQGTALSILPPSTIGPLVLDPSARTIQVKNRPSRRLTQLEFRLLYTLMLHRGQTLSPDIIVERVWGYGAEGNLDLVRGLVRRLRAKVEEDPRHPRYIITVPGLGYRLDVPAGNASAEEARPSTSPPRRSSASD